VGSSISCVHRVWLDILCSMQMLAGRLALSWAPARTCGYCSVVLVIEDEMAVCSGNKVNIYSGCYSLFFHWLPVRAY
jgi:hypothetical protein